MWSTAQHRKCPRKKDGPVGWKAERAQMGGNEMTVSVAEPPAGKAQSFRASV